MIVMYFSVEYLKFGYVTPLTLKYVRFIILSVVYELLSISTYLLLICTYLLLSQYINFTSKHSICSFYCQRSERNINSQHLSQSFVNKESTLYVFDYYYVKSKKKCNIFRDRLVFFSYLRNFIEEIKIKNYVKSIEKEKKKILY